MTDLQDSSASETNSEAKSEMISQSISSSLVSQITPRIGELDPGASSSSPPLAPNAPLLRNGSPSNTSPKYLSFALPSQSVKSEQSVPNNLMPIPQPTSNSSSSNSSDMPSSTSLATLAAKVTARLIAQYPPSVTPLDRSSQAQLISEMQRFVAKALPTESITPSTPFVVMHALLLVHRILRSGSRYTTSNQQNSSSPLIRNITTSSSATTSTTIPQINPMPSPLPASLHSPTNLLIAGFILADSFFSDNPTRTRTWSDLSESIRNGDLIAQIKRDALICLAYDINVGEREFALWCSTVRKWAAAGTSNNAPPTSSASVSTIS
ncbi:hypothetical protein BDR26DRAFT_856499 [Obelidium mucronatum]|nr:hypothetical protein BDR26DRAFT_856499 [Obelidium mucronatum]